MATVTWIGKQSLHSDPNDATDPLNWVGGVVPQAGDTVVMNGGSIGAAVALDLIGQPGTMMSSISQTIQIAGPFDTLNFTQVAAYADTLTAGNGASAGQGAVIDFTDSLIDSSSLTVGNNAVLNLSGSSATSMQITQNAGTSLILQSGTGESLVINATGTVNTDSQMWILPGGQATINVAQLGTISGFLQETGALINNGGTLTINGDSNNATRFSNQGFMLVYGGRAPALDQFNARMNGISGLINILGGASGATLDDKTNLPGSQIINFADGNGVMKVEANTVLPAWATIGTTNTTVMQNDFARISGFQPGDTIQLVGMNPTGLSYSFGSDANYGPDVLTINRGTTEVARIRFQASEFTAGTGTIDGAATGNFKLVSAGSDTLITLGNSQNVVNNGTTIAVTGTLANWGGVTTGATTDWSAANWTGGTGAGGVPGPYQTAQLPLTATEATAAAGGVFNKYDLTVTTAETAGSVNFSDPLATLTLTAPLTLSALPGESVGGGFAANQGKLDIAAGGTLSTTRFYAGAGNDLTMDPGSVLTVSGIQSFTFGGGLAGVDEEGYGQISGGNITSGGNVVVGQNSNGSLIISNNVITNTGTSTVYGPSGSHVSATYTQVGGSVSSGAQTAEAYLQIAGPNTTYTDAGGDASTPFSGALLVGGGNLSVNALGTVALPSGGVGYVNVMDGATLTDASYAMLGVTGSSSGTVNLNNNARWNIGLGSVTPPGSIVVGNAVVGSTTLVTNNLPWLTVGGGGLGNLMVSSSVVQIGTGEAFNTAKVIVGGGSVSNSAATGSVTIQGTGATLDTGGGPMVVGQRSSGSLTIGNGGAVIVGSSAATTDLNFGLAIGNRNGTVGSFSSSVSLFPGGTLIDYGDLVVGRDSVGTLSISSSSTAHVSGGVYLGGFLSLNNGTSAIAPTLVKGAATGLLSINGGGVLTATAGTLDMWQGSTITLQSAQLTVGSADSLLGEMTVGFGAIVQGAGMIMVNSNDSTLRNSGTVLSGGLTNSGTQSQAGATLELNAVLAGGGVYALSPSSVMQVDNGNVGTVNFDFGTGNVGAAPTAPEILRLVSPVSFQGTVSHLYGLGTGANRIDLVNAGFVTGGSVPYTPNADPTTGGTITVGTTLGAGSVHIAVSGYHPLGFQATSDGAGGTYVFASDAVACFTQGTRILTAAGERAVEAIRVGDLVPTAGSGRLRRVVWTGSTRIDLDRHATPELVGPVRILAGAFAPGVPHRDLIVSPDHAVWTGAALVPAHLLANGTTVRRERAEGSVTYWHIELDQHDLLLAEGLASESYLDTGNRGQFAGEPGARALQPDMLADLAARAWDERAYRPLTQSGGALRRAQAMLAGRAAALGHRLDGDPAVMLLADGVPLDMAGAAEGRLVAMVPAGTRRVVLASRSVVPHEIDAGNDDRRRLGVAITAIRFAGTGLALDGTVAATGFHPCEVTDGGMMRWTDGLAVLDLPPRMALDCLEIDLIPGIIAYPVAPETARPAVRAAG